MTQHATPPKPSPADRPKTVLVGRQHEPTTRDTLEDIFIAAAKVVILLAFAIVLFVTILELIKTEKADRAGRVVAPRWEPVGNGDDENDDPVERTQRRTRER